MGVNTFQLRRCPDFEMGNVTEETVAGVAAPAADHDRGRRGGARGACRRRHALGDPGLRGRSLDVECIGNGAPRTSSSRPSTPSYFAIKNWTSSEGRAFTQQEVNAGAPVVVLGKELAQKLLPRTSIRIGQTVTLGGLPYRVIGVVEKQGTLFGISLDKFR